MCSLIDFLVLAKLSLITHRDWSENSLGEDSENCIIVVLTDGKVDIAACKYILA